MIGSLFFICNRIVELLFLIPIVGMMAYFVNGYLNANEITPPYVLVIFIVSVIAAFWCLDTLIRFSTTKRSAIFVACVDLLFFGAFIAGVYELRFIAGAKCSHWDGGSVYISLGPFGYYGYRDGNPLSFHIDKTCAMLKASFALGIIEIVLFFWTAILALAIYRRPDVIVKETTTVRRRSHSSRRGHRRHSSSGRRHHYEV
ncbi:hypothetical protein BO70DRAFT_333913 [Aspergillus heteromorphus CBS 117.55]|uniref:MARVEL domain-containing protein n=1 Tax=Aspergillus heteromorphus CBS 117.55 TaxID=1448321 RepID=A0A317WHQ9_9EURO|nr:uncharacterized protein BO70DRAFT_333913 [Aspergillus heteromorphus CBS 117.55]PWY85986.1 hypothetical protein BO70DRAFT_333913 [Aspergillus heteromorphus CBS 117.55]